MQDDLAGLIAELHDASEGYADCGKSSLAVRLQRAATALETLTRERDEARAEVERLNDTLRPYVEAVHREHDGHVSEINTLRAQLTATQARLGEAEHIIKQAHASAEQSSAWPPQRRDASLDGILKITANFLAQQEG